MIQPSAPAVNEEATNGPIPALKEGDRLTRAEFERRYDAMPELKKAELINGVVYMPSPVRFQQHGRPDRLLTSWSVLYEINTPGVLGSNNTSIRLIPESEPQPDLLLLISPDCGGRARISVDDYLVGGPELLGEVSASSIEFDLGAKFDLYLQNGVCEYIVWRVPDREVDWFIRRGGRFERLPMDDHGIYRSEIFPGLWLDVPALLRADMQALVATLQRGLETPEHAVFVKKLNPGK